MKKFIIFLFIVFIVQNSFSRENLMSSLNKDGVSKGADSDTLVSIHSIRIRNRLFTIYSKDKEKVYYYGLEIKGADPETFEVIDEWYVKDKNHVYDPREDHKIYRDYDGKTFEVLGYYFVKDKNGVYFQNVFMEEPLKLEYVDSSSVEILWGTSYLKDKNRVYFYQRPNSFNDTLVVKELQGADPISFEPKTYGSYSRDKKNLYWDGEILVGANPDTFKQIMATSFGTDGQNIYFGSKRLEDADINTFKLKDREIGVTNKYIYFAGTKLEGIESDNVTFLNKYYIKNDSVAYFRNSRIKEADAPTFEDIPSWGYEAKDKNHYYINGIINPKEPLIFGVHTSGVYFRNYEACKLKDADPASFKILNEAYGKDKNHVYWTEKKLEDADPISFQAFNSSFGRDSKSVYFGNKKIEKAEAKTFEPLNQYYGKDSKNIFYGDKIVSNADLESFEAISNLYARDNNYAFFQDSIINGADNKTFSIIDLSYSKDENHVYFKTKKVENADPKTFQQFIGSVFWVDKNYVFIDGVKLENSDSNTFQSLDGYFYMDKNNIYRNYKIADIDRNSFKILTKGYAVDKDHVYVNGSISEELDVKSFDIKNIRLY